MTERTRVSEANIRIIALGPNDWLVLEEGGAELGRFSSRDEAEAVGQPLAAKRNVGLTVQGLDGQVWSVAVRPRLPKGRAYCGADDRVMARSPTCLCGKRGPRNLSYRFQRRRPWNR